VKNGTRYSKNGKVVSKFSQNKEQMNYQLCSVELNKIIIMDTKVEIKQMPELNVVYYRHTGSFDEISKAYEKLYKWAVPRGLITDKTRNVTVYLDDPSITSIDKLRQDASITVTGNVKVEGEISKSTIPAGKYAVGRFEINDTQFEDAWNTMYAWLSESGFEPAIASPYELYHNKYEDHKQHIFIMDICIPVKPM